MKLLHIFTGGCRIHQAADNRREEVKLHMVHGTWYMVHGTWYMVHGTVERDLANVNTQGYGKNPRVCIYLQLGGRG